MLASGEKLNLTVMSEESYCSVAVFILKLVPVLQGISSIRAHFHQHETLSLSALPATTSSPRFPTADSRDTARRSPPASLAMPGGTVAMPSSNLKLKQK